MDHRMSSEKIFNGTCLYCNKEISKAGVSRHLSTCESRIRVLKKAVGNRTETFYHVRVQDAYRKEFWLNLEICGSYVLEELDFYLRSIWLECCGHMSRFSPSRWDRGEIGMEHKMRDVFSEYSQLIHIYDFGTSSQTLVKVVGSRNGALHSKRPISLMTRNSHPKEKCIECNSRATWFCTECLMEKQVWGILCDKHVESHPHRNYGDPIPLINSPRLGMCAYTGPAEPPY